MKQPSKRHERRFDRRPLRRSVLSLAALILLCSGVVAGLAAGGGTRDARAAQSVAAPRIAPQQVVTPTVDPFFFLTPTVVFFSPLATPTSGPTPTFTPTLDPTFIEVRRATINAASGANMRAAANINSGVISVLDNGSVHVVNDGPLTGGDAAQWVELALAGGTRGWVKAELVNIQSERLPYAEAVAILSPVGIAAPAPGAAPPTPTPTASPVPTITVAATVDPFASSNPLSPGQSVTSTLVTTTTNPLSPTTPLTATELVTGTLAPTATSAPTATTAPTVTLAPLTVEQLRAAAWVVPSLDVTGTIQFVEGVFANTTTGLRVVLTDTLVAIGDITGDGAADAAAILQVTQPDGTETWDLVVAVNQGAEPASVTGVELGGPLVVDELRIEKGAIWLETRILGPGDDPCCPTLPLKRIYVLRGDTLVEFPAASYGRTFPYRYGALYGYVNVLGEFVVPPIYTFADSYHEGFAVVSRDGKRYGYINSLGQEVIPLQYTLATPFAGGVALVGLADQDAVQSQVIYIDGQGRNVFGDQIFGAGQPFSEGLAAVRSDNGLFGYIDSKGELRIPATFDSALSFSEGLAPVLQEDRVGYINRQGTLVVPIQYDAGAVFSEGLAAVAISGTVGYIDHSGTFAIEPTLERGAAFVDGLAPVEVDGVHRYIDAFGRTQIEGPDFAGAQEFSEGLAAVQVNDLFGYVNRQGAFAIAPQFQVANPFSNGMATVETNDRWGVIANDGTWLVQLTLAPIQPVSSTAATTATVALDLPAEPATQIVSFVPAVPDEIRPGACYGSSDIVAGASAWRCGLTGGEVFDPCILAADGRTVVCDADPVSGTSGFVLELTQPLPAEAIEGKDRPGAWIFELASGAVCRYTQETTVVIEGERVNYSCSDRTQLLGEINKSAPLWTIDAITTGGTAESGLRVESRTPVVILRSWRPGPSATSSQGN